MSRDVPGRVMTALCPRCGYDLRSEIPHWQTTYPCRRCRYGAGGVRWRLGGWLIKHGMFRLGWWVSA